MTLHSDPIQMLRAGAHVSGIELDDGWTFSQGNRPGGKRYHHYFDADGNMFKSLSGALRSMGARQPTRDEMFFAHLCLAGVEEKDRCKWRVSRVGNRMEFSSPWGVFTSMSDALDAATSKSCTIRCKKRKAHPEPEGEALPLCRRLRIGDNDWQRELLDELHEEKVAREACEFTISQLQSQLRAASVHIPVPDDGLAAMDVSDGLADEKFMQSIIGDPDRIEFIVGLIASNRLDKYEVTALISYTTTDYTPLNAFLRDPLDTILSLPLEQYEAKMPAILLLPSDRDEFEGAPMQQIMFNLAKRLYTAVTKLLTDPGCRFDGKSLVVDTAALQKSLWRGVSWAGFLEKQIDGRKLPLTLVDRGFMSTSESKPLPRDTLIMIPRKGYEHRGKGLRMKAFSANPAEEEILFDRNTTLIITELYERKRLQETLGQYQESSRVPTIKMFKHELGFDKLIDRIAPVGVSSVGVDRLIVASLCVDV